MDLVQLVPTLPPSLSGIGDYAVLLAGELAAAHGVRTRFVVGDPGWRGNENAVPHPAAAVPARTAAALLRTLADAGATGGGAPVLLHYVGYGYAPRGCPFWLVDAMERWKRATGGRLLVIFHELYADGEPIWSSAFWTSPFQKRLALRLGRLADARRMTTAPAAAQLRAMLGAAGQVPNAADVTPVFSTLGEPPASALLPPASRKRQMVVFGSRSWRLEAYTVHAAALASACRRLEIARVVDVGAPVDVPAGLAVLVEKMGPLPAAEACALFGRSLAGFFTYPVPYLGKSTIFAAYCASGLVPVTPAANLRPSGDGLRAGQHYLFADDNPRASGWDNPGAVAAAARAWYDEHRLAAHARGIAEGMEAEGRKTADGR